jgi:hypothetical protein
VQYSEKWFSLWIYQRGAGGLKSWMNASRDLGLGPLASGYKEQVDAQVQTSNLVPFAFGSEGVEIGLLFELIN